MNALLPWVLVGLGLAAIAVRGRRLAVGLVTAQTGVLAGLALREADSATDLVAAVAPMVRALAIAGCFLLLINRTGEVRPTPDGLAPLRRAAAGAGLALILNWLVPPMPSVPVGTQRAVIAMVALGLVAAATSRATLLQVLGIVAIDNAFVLAALSLPVASWLIEIGLAFDLVIIVAVAAVFHRRIFVEFGAGDTGALRSLRD